MTALVVVQPGQKLATLAGVHGDFADWVLAGMVWNAAAVRVQPHLGDDLPAAAGVSAVVVTGSSAMVTDGDAWIEAASAWVRELARRDVPVLGICFGHQLVAQALGGVVRDNPNGIEVGTVQTRLAAGAADDALFAGLPATMSVQASHRQSVLRLPHGAIPMAASDKDPHHAFRYGRNVWGVQFHPEFDRRIVRAYADYYRPSLAAQGDDADQIIAAATESPAAIAVLAAFTRLIRGERSSPP